MQMVQQESQAKQCKRPHRVLRRDGEPLQTVQGNGKTQGGRCPQRKLLNGGCVMPMWFDIQEVRRRKSHPDDVWLKRSAVPI